MKTSLVNQLCPCGANLIQSTCYAAVECDLELFSVPEMNGAPSTIPESGRCNVCGQVFIREGSLTKHLRDHCSAARRRSQEHWKNSIPNVMKLGRRQNKLRRQQQDKIPDDSGADGENTELTNQSIMVGLCS